ASQACSRNRMPKSPASVLRRWGCRPLPAACPGIQFLGEGEEMTNSIESVLVEKRVFPPPADLSASANISGMTAYHALCDEAERDFEGFWARLARENLQWTKPFTRVLDETDAPFYRWFDDGERN